MSTPIKKKTRRKKKKAKGNEIVFVKHEKVGNVNLFSEEVCKNILEKIISLTYSESFKNYIRKRSHEITLQICENMISNLIEITHINHDVDDFDIDKIEINSYVNYNNTDSNVERYLVKKHNIARKIRNEKAKNNLIKSNNSQIIENDLNKSVLVNNNKYFTKEKIYQFSIDPTKINFWGNIPCPHKPIIDRTLVNHNIFIPAKQVIKEVKEIETEIKEPKKTQEVTDKNKNSKKTFSYRNFISNLYKRSNFVKTDNDTDFLGDITKKNQIRENPDFHSYPLEDLEERKELANIDELRIEALELSKKKEKLNTQKHVYKRQKTREEIENEKKIKAGKFTYDENGKMILINEIKQEQLIKEFYPIMSKPKNIKLGKTFDTYQKELIKMEKRAKKNIAYNKPEDETLKLSTVVKKTRASQPLVNINSLNDSLKDIIKELSKDSVKNSPKKEKDKGKDKEKEINLLNQSKKKKIEPSGSNFQLINPAVGVTIKEKRIEKSGGTDFFKEFHKYSIEEYNRTLQENLEWGRIHLLEKQKEEFNTMDQVELPNLKKNNFAKNIIKTGKGKGQSITEINPINAKMAFNQRLINQNSRNRNFDGINISENYNSKKSMAKSTSEIVLDNDKLKKLKQILFHDKEDEKIKLNRHKNKNTSEKDIILEYRNKSSIRQRNKKVIRIKKRFNDIDDLNRDIITGNAVQQMDKNSKIVLPKLSLKNNETNFNKTMINFVRERTKKSMWEEYIRQKEINKDIKFWKINFGKTSE